MTEIDRHYEFIAEYSNDVIFTTNLTGHFVYVNPAAELLLGMPLSDIVGTHFLSFVRPDFHEKITAFYEKQYIQRIPNTYFEYPVMAHDGTTRWLGQNVQLLSGEGKITGLQAIARDITDRKKAEEALRQAEENFRRSLDESLLGIRIVTTKGKTIYANREILTIHGFRTIDEFNTTPVSIHYTPDSYAEHQIRKKKRERGEPTSSEYEISIIRPDGEVRHLRVFRKEILWNGELQFQVIHHDITERTQAEEALRESERKYRELIDFLPISLFEIDLDGNVMSANPAAFETFCYTQADFEKGLNRFEMIIPDDRERLSDNIQKLIRGEKKGPSEYTGIRKDGATFPFLIYPSVIIRDGTPVGLRGAIIDLTERKRMEESIKKSNMSLAEAQRIAHVGNWEWGIDDRTMYWSDEMRRIAGHTLPAPDGSIDVFVDLVVPEDRAKVKKAVENALYEGVPGDIEHRVVRSDGAVRDIHHLVEPIADTTGKIVRLIGIVQDVTEKKQAEQELEQARRQVLQTDKLAAMGRLSAGVAHEILNPTNVISLQIQMLHITEQLSPEVTEELQICMNQVNRIVRIAENLKQFSRIPEKQIITADINSVIDHVLTLYATQLKIEEIATEVHYQPDLPPIAMDRGKIEQVILNLITNAVTAMEGQDTKVLRITTVRETKASDDDAVKITITDTGTGITPEHMSNIFDPFFTTDGQGKGTGLGLSISYGIIHDHGGAIWAENNQEGGVSFHFTLPITPDAVSLPQ
jgi:PAS domain S-box-containing protein